jgi:hypothetical protein
MRGLKFQRAKRTRSRRCAERHWPGRELPSLSRSSCTSRCNEVAHVETLSRVEGSVQPGTYHVSDKAIHEAKYPSSRFLHAGSDLIESVLDEVLDGAARRRSKELRHIVQCEFCVRGTPRRIASSATAVHRRLRAIRRRSSVFFRKRATSQHERGVPVRFRSGSG